MYTVKLQLKFLTAVFFSLRFQSPKHNLREESFVVLFIQWRHSDLEWSMLGTGILILGLRKNSGF